MKNTDAEQTMTLMYNAWRFWWVFSEENVWQVLGCSSMVVSFKIYG
ncbi:hypothetical protein [Photobacterium frigidiphilum]|nr:hypothetical protein [Photobacterium frigidiphilum]